jgi:hypothetical protein
MAGGRDRPEFSTVPASAVPAVTAEQMRKVDRIMIDDLHIELIQMMEHAGRNLAELALRRFDPATVTVLAGPGGNGGGGLVAARPGEPPRRCEGRAFVAGSDVRRAAPPARHRRADGRRGVGRAEPI